MRYQKSRKSNNMSRTIIKRTNNYNKQLNNFYEKNMTKGIDEIPGEHNAKSWFKIMLKNQYLWLATLMLTGIIWYSIKYGTEGYIWPNVAWPLILGFGLLAIIRLGFIKFWNELKGKR